MELYKSTGLNSLNHLRILVQLIKVIELQTFKYRWVCFIAITSASTINICESGKYLIITITLHIFETI